MKAQFQRFFFPLIGVLLVLTLVIPLSTRAAPAPDTQFAPTDTPIIVLEEPEHLSDWTVGNALLYWERDCAGDETPSGTYALKRRPLYGTAIRELERVDRYHCDTFLGIVADASGVYYIDQESSTIKRRPTDDPDTAQVLYTYTREPATDLALDEHYVYWGVSNRVFRVPKEGGQRERVVLADWPVTDILPTGSGVYWLDKEGLWFTSVTCGNLPCSNSHKVSIQFPDRAHTLLHRTSTVMGLRYWYTYWVKYVDAAQKEEIHRYSCSMFSCSDSVLYTASVGWKVESIIWASAHLYWIERRPGEGRIRRMPLGGGQADVIAYVMAPGDYLYADAYYLYFADLAQMRIFKLPFSASALSRDLAITKWEVTQGIQSPANDVPLVAHKPTYVRVYGQINDGPAVASVEAAFYGFRNHQALPGSPLHPIANAHQYLAPGDVIDRSQRNEGWLFRLPDSWTAEGAITLRAEIDPEGIYEDNVPANDTIEDTFTFTEKAPVCIVWIPVRTHAPRPSRDNPNYRPMLNLAKRLWPTTDYWTWYQSEDIAEWNFFYFSPYEIPEDIWKILLSLNTRDAFTDDPDRCDDVGATTHYVGMVHADTSTDWVAGAAWTEHNDVAWVKFPPEDERPDSDHDWNFPEAGLTLAHELAHNKGRKHVDCGEPEGVDHNYPYPTNQFDYTGPDRHYGFDVNSYTPIAPDAASDLMSYCFPQWISDYTWKALFSKLHGASSVEGSGREGAWPDVGDAGALVYASGVITPTEHLGELHHAWTLPIQAMSQAMRRKWQRQFTPTYAEVGVADAENGSTTYHLRLLDGDGKVLSDRTVSLPESIDGVSDGQAQGFSLTFVAPLGTVRRMELLENSTIIAARAMGAGDPQIQIVAPQGGEIYYDEMTITWRGHDPDGDPLRYHVQYSPDNGKTWQILVTDIPQPIATDTITLTLDDLDPLPGIQLRGGRIRVLASDGYHTSMATSQAFTIANRKPEAFITAPVAHQSFLPGAPIVFQGSAMDAEDGPLSDKALEWRLDGHPFATGEEAQTAGMAPGQHQVQLVATDSLSQQGSDAISFEVLPLSIPSSTQAPALDGSCDDAVYAQAVNLPLEPYNDGSQALVSLVRTDEHLWACFTGLMQTSSSESWAGIRVDVDHSRDAWAQSTDYGFFMKEDGTALTWAGDGSGAFGDPGPGGLVAQLSTYGDHRWRIEMRIDSDVLDGWGHLVGLELGHYGVPTRDDNYRWPYDSAWNRPNTWATAALGVLPHLNMLEPASAAVGDAAFTLTLHGAHFSEQDRVLWNGSALPTTYVDANTLQAQVAADKLNAAGVIDVSVRAATNSSFSSNSLPFSILNPVPHMTTISPDHAYAHGSGFTLQVTGTDFVSDATVYWDNLPLSTTFVSNSTLRATVASSLLKQPGAHGVTVINPSPGGGASNTLYFALEQLQIYLPLTLNK